MSMGIFEFQHEFNKIVNRTLKTIDDLRKEAEKELHSQNKDKANRSEDG